MNRLIKSLQISYKTFFRRKSFSFAYGLLVFITNTLLFIFWGPDQSAVEFLSDTMCIGQLGMACFVFLGYELFSTLACEENIEAISIKENATEYLIFAQIITLLSLIIFWSINLFIWQVWGLIINDLSYIPFLLHASLSIILNCIIPAYIGSLLGAILSLSMRRSKAYCLILLFLILSSNIPPQVFASEKIVGVPILVLWDWFALLAPNTDYIADSIYGIANEECRWMLAVFWISLLSVALLFRINKSSRFTRLPLLVLVPLVFFSAYRFADRGTDSIIRKDWRPNGLIVGEATYRTKMPIENEKKAVFEVDRYDLRINIGRNLTVNAILSLKQVNMPSYDFTLLHNLEIDDITDEQGRSLTFSRYGDFVTVYTERDIQEIHFEYSGNCGKYFSNYQGVALPGYIPFYPMAGHINLWCENDQSFKVCQDLPRSLFHIEIDSPLTIRSNLPSQGRNVFEGTTDTVSLYAGMLTATQIGNTICYSSPVSNYHVELGGCEQVWAELSALVGENREFDLYGKTVFVQPETIMVVNALHERVALFDDHVILDSRLSTAEQICQEYLFNLIPESKSKQLLLNLLKNSITLQNFEQEVFEKPAWNDVKILAEYESSGDIADINEWSRYNTTKKTALKTLWDYQITTHGRAAVVKEVYHYLISPENQTNQIEFLYSLGEK